MITILVADDEHHIANYLTELLYSQGWDVDIYTAYSGMEVLELAKENVFNLVLLDIEMPGFSGLKTAFELHRLYPRTRILFLTAYDNFEYIYSATDMNCCGYLLKIEPEEIILSKILEIINSIQNELLQLTKVTQLEQTTVQLLISCLQPVLKGICTGWSAERATTELSLIPAKYLLNTSSPVYLMYAHHVVHQEQFSIYNFAQSHFQMMSLLLSDHFSCYPFYCDNNDILWFFQSHSPNTISPISFLKHAIDEFISTLYKSEQICSQAVFFCEPISFQDIHRAYYRLKYFDNGIFQNSTPCVFFADHTSLPIDANSQESPESIERQLELLATALYNSNKTDFFLILNTLKTVCHVALPASLVSGKIIYSISLLLLKFIEQKNIQNACKEKGVLQNLLNTELSDSAFENFERTAHIIFDTSAKDKITKSKKIIKHIQNYICQNYTFPITLSSLASAVNYNESYISRIFKSETGRGIVEYLASVRIEHACQLLENTNLAIQDISNSVGFDSPQYFSIVFRKNKGVTPTEYRNIHQKN